MVKRIVSYFKEHMALSCILVIFLSAFALFCRQILSGRTIVPIDIILGLSPWSSFYSVKTYNHIISDIVREAFPWIIFFVKSIKQGIVPLWNPFVASGTPTPTAFFPIFYPLWPILLLSTPLHSFGFYLMTHIFLAGLFTFLFLRELKVGYFGSLVGSLVFMFSQIAIHWSESIIGPASIIWLPLECLLVARIIKTRKLVYSILFAVVISISFFGGMLQWFYYSILTTGAYAIFLLAASWLEEHDFKSLLSKAGLLSLALVLFLGLTAVQSMPTLELGKYIIRTGETADYVAGSVLGFRQIVTYLVPNIFGNPVHKVGWNINLEWFMNSGYIGILALLFAFIGSIYSKNKEKWFFLSLAIATSILAFVPLVNKIFYYILPFYNRFRSVGRWLLIYAFAGAVLAAFGADCIGNINKEEKDKIVGIRRAVTVFAVSAILFVALVFWKALLMKPPVYYLLKQGLIFLVFLILSVVLIQSFLMFREKVSFLKFAAIVLVIIDIFSFIFSFYPSLDPAWAYPKVPSLKYLTSDKSLYRIARYEKAEMPSVITPTLTPSVSLVYGIADVQQSSVFILDRYITFLNLIEDHSKQAGTNEIPSFINSASLDSNLLDMINVKYILSLVPLENNGLQLVYDNEIKIYKNKDVLPRVFFVPNWKVIQNDKELQDSLKDKEFNPREVVFVEDAPPADEDVSKSQVDNGSKIDIRKFNANEIVVNAVVPKDGFLFFGDNYYPGWRAQIDGKQSKIYRANYCFKAVFLKKGSHKVRFIFLPKSLATGGKVSLVTFCLCIAILVANFLWKRRSLSQSLKI